MKYAYMHIYGTALTIATSVCLFHFSFQTAMAAMHVLITLCQRNNHFSRLIVK